MDVSLFGELFSSEWSEDDGYYECQFNWHNFTAIISMLKKATDAIVDDTFKKINQPRKLKNIINGWIISGCFIQISATCSGNTHTAAPVAPVATPCWQCWTQMCIVLYSRQQRCKLIVAFAGICGQQRCWVCSVFHYSK
jgi:hypothetical protein